jgi:ribosome maturation factor RimP
LITEQQIEDLILEHLDGGDKFLVALKVRPGNKIMVFIDGDSNVTIDDCVKLSRFLESKLDRDVNDFELQISSAGIDQPLKFARQYPKNIGRGIKVITAEGEMLIGTLVSADNNGINIKIPAEKKKKIEERQIFVPFEKIKESKIEISFKK